MNQLPKRSALLIIDMQNGLFFADDEPFDKNVVLENINLLIANARTAGAHVFAVRHTGPAGSPIEPGSERVQLIPGLNVDIETDTVFDKTRPDCFVQTPLLEILRELAVNELVITGMKTEYCVDTTCRAASALGLNPVLISDAHTTTGNGVLSASEIIAHHNLTLAGPFVKLTSAAGYHF